MNFISGRQVGAHFLQPRCLNMKSISLYLMAAVYMVAGINHFLHPQTYLSIMPAFLPVPLFLVYLSGVLEIGLGSLLLPKTTRAYAAWGIIILLIFIFPANIQMAINYWQTHNPYKWLAIARLPLQLFLIWWAYTFTKK